MQPNNLDKSLIEHTIIMGVTRVVAVQASLYQEVCNHRGEYDGLLIRDNHGLLSKYLTNCPTCILFIAALAEYHVIVVTNNIDEEIIFTEADCYLVEIVQPTTIINEL
jgi:hypothetical protein